MFYKLDKGIFVLMNPQMADISVDKYITFQIEDAENCILEINKTIRSKIDEKGECIVNIKNLNKGDNTMRVIMQTKEGYKIFPCQPFAIFDYGDTIKCAIATSLDVMEFIKVITEKLDNAYKRLAELEKLNLEEVRNNVNKIAGIVNDLQERTNDLEKNFDPTA